MAIEKTIPEIKETTEIVSVTLNVRRTRTWKNADETDVTETSEVPVEIQTAELSRPCVSELEGKIR